MGHEEHGWMPYCGAAVTPANWLASWNFDPFLIIALLLTSAYFLRQQRQADGAASRQASLAGQAAVASMALLYLTPFCPLGSTFFTARVVHHMALVLFVAPLAAIALPGLFARVRGSLALWTVLSALAFWFWHAPQAYAWALSSDAVFWLMQLSILLSAAVFWARVRAAEPAYALAALLATTVQMGLLGALITFARSPLYAPHFDTVQAWGWTALQDQQYAGITMWAPGCFAYLFAAMFVGWRWLRQDRESSAPAVARIAQ